MDRGTATVALTILTIGLVAGAPIVAAVAPTLSNASPTGTSHPDEFSIDVSDADFPNDEVTVELTLDDHVITTQTVSSSRTVTGTYDGDALEYGETYTWNVTATDDDGMQAVANTTFTVPENITIREEDNASALVEDQGVDVTFYTDNGQVTLGLNDSNQDGNISLAGLPRVPAVLKFEDPSGVWYTRQVYFRSLAAQQNFYLRDTEGHLITFAFEDRTGNFPQSETTIQIERAVDINDDDTADWDVIAGDYWNAAGRFTFRGTDNARYRIRVTNQESGDSRLVGHYVPTSDATENIIIGNIVFEADNETGRYVHATISNDTNNLQFIYSDPTNSSTGVNITVYEQGNQSNVLYTNTFAGPLGTQTVTQSLTDAQLETNWIVEYDVADTDDGPQFYKVIVGEGGYLLPMDGDILAAFAYLITTFVMLLYGPRTALFGAWAGVIVFTGFAWLGWVSGVTLAVPVLIAIGATLYSEALP